MMERSSGILLHITSLPSPYGIGSLGREAFSFADFLHAAKQRYWQVLPLGPTGCGDSPYQSFSAFAGNPYCIDLDLLVEDGLLSNADIASLPYGGDPRAVSYDLIFLNRPPLLRRAFSAGFLRDGERVRAFMEAQAGWLDAYALFMALKAHFGMRPWWDWPEDIKLRHPSAVEEYRGILKEEIDFHIYTQYLFFKQWSALTDHCRSRGVSIIGDLPIYVSLDSADVWADRALFDLDPAGAPTHVAGVPPDFFSATGQLWGNPLYRWEYLKQTGYAWWMRRIGHALQLYDLLRLDHFRGLASYWRVPAHAATAAEGEWAEGPGMDFIGRVNERFSKHRFIAEDLGILSPDVFRLLEESGYPGMKILQFAFGGGAENPYLPHRYGADCVCYTGTHDNTTAMGFFHETNPEEAAHALRYFGLNAQEGLHWGLMRGGMASNAHLFVFQMQDCLGLSSDARMNTPGTLFGNWRWRISKEALDGVLAKRISDMTALYGRG